MSKKLNNLLKILENSNANITKKKLDTTQLVEEKILLKYLSKTSSNLLKIDVSNLMSDSGLKTFVTRTGDNNLRMDALSTIGKNVYAVEIENLANLDSPRNILDSLAVLHSRYEISKGCLGGIIVVSTFPSKRSEFWEVVNDIQRVTELNIYIIPLYALIILKNENCRLSNFLDAFKFNQTFSFRKELEEIIDKKIELNYPNKLIEAEK
jgi:hypothetical protein